MPATPNDRPCLPSARSSFSAWTAWGAVVLLLAPPAIAVWTAAGLVTDIPWGDQLTLVRDTRIIEGVTLGSLFRFHNEHLVVPTRLMVAADYRLWHGANILPALGTLAFTLAIIAIEAWMFHRAEPLGRGQAAVATALLAAVLLNGRLTWTLTFPMLLQHASANFFVVATLAAFAPLAAGTIGRRGPAWIVCLGAALLAAISSASGVFALPAAAAAAAALAAVSPPIRRGPWRGAVLTYAALGLVVIGGYAALHAAAADGGRPAPHFSGAIRFALYFPGGAWFRDGTWPIVHRADPLLLHAVVLGFWTALALAGRRLWQRRAALGEFELFHVAVLFFVAMTAVAGGLFRAEFGDLEALNKKYASTALLAWASLASLLVRDMAGWLFAPGMRGKARPLAMAAAVAVAILPGDAVEYRAWRAWRDQLGGAIAAYAAGDRSDDVLLGFHRDAREAERLLEPIAADKGYWFRHGSGPVASGRGSEPPVSRLDRLPGPKDFSLEFIDEQREPLGRPRTVIPAGQATLLRGWAVDRDAGRHAAGVALLVDGRRFEAIHGLPRPDVAEYFSRPGYAASGFRCLLPPGTLEPGDHELRVRIILADGERYLETPPHRLTVE